MNPIKFYASTSWSEVLNDCSVEMRCEVYDAIFQYAATKKTPKFSSDFARGVFAFIKAAMKAEDKRAERIRKTRSESVKKRWKKEKQQGNGD